MNRDTVNVHPRTLDRGTPKKPPPFSQIHHSSSRPRGIVVDDQDHPAGRHRNQGDGVALTFPRIDRKNAEVNASAVKRVTG